MEPTFKVSVTMNVDRADGTPFFINHTSWETMDYAGMVLIEKKLVGVLGELVAFAEDSIATGDAGPAAPAAAPAAPAGDSLL